ncbi:MAG: FIST C-terminal domain-containing protein [Actinobacteria bacterium]|nr:FIST C-terminal domain-containing protein [Actinomycetota bacterium]
MRVHEGIWTPERGWTPPVDELREGALAGGRNTLVIAFADPALRDSLGALAELERVLPSAIVIGCSTAGQILGGEVVTAPLVVAVAHFDTVTPVVAWARAEEAGSSTGLGALLGDRLASTLAPGVPGTVFVLGDGIVVNGSELVEGLRSALPSYIGISGGLAGDGDRFGQTWVYVAGAARLEAAVAVVLAAPGLRVGYGSAGGWDGFGPARVVTRSLGNVLFELDGRPALELYRDYLGDRAAQLPASALLFPLAIRSPDGDRTLVRTVLGIDDDASSMTFAGDVPEGWTAQLMRTTLDRLIDAAGIAADQATRSVAEPELTIAVSCVGRKLVLGQRSEEEIEAAHAFLGSAPAVVGFYSYGEISPHLGTSELHNQTMTLTTLTERPDA